jgi:hypothetical protein
MLMATRADPATSAKAYPEAERQATQSPVESGL